MIDPASWNVYLVTDRGFSRGRTTLEIVEAAVAGGVSAVQLREKNLNTLDFYREGLAIRDFLRNAGVPLIINDRIDIALALDADGVHLGQKDMPVDVAGRILGSGFIIGLSIEKPEQLTDRTACFADYTAVSPLFATNTKADTAEPWGIEGLRKARSMTDRPLMAIGSINVSNAGEVAAAGADCVAVVTAITAADDPKTATELLVGEVIKGKREFRALISRTG